MSSYGANLQRPPSAIVDHFRRACQRQSEFISLCVLLLRSRPIVCSEYLQNIPHICVDGPHKAQQFVLCDVELVQKQFAFGEALPPFFQIHSLRGKELLQKNRGEEGCSVSHHLSVLLEKLY